MDELIDRQRIVNFCRVHGSVTVRDCYDKLNMNSPTKRISELRHSPDYVVEDIWESRINSLGIKKRYKRYFIKECAAHGSI